MWHLWNLESLHLPKHGWQWQDLIKSDLLPLLQPQWQDSLCHLHHHQWSWHLLQPQWQDLRQHVQCKWLCLWQHQWVQSLQCPWHLGGLSLKFRRGDTGPSSHSSAHGTQ